MSLYVVTAFRLNMREAASLDASVIKVVDRGEQVTGLNASPNGYWLQVRDASGDQGWVSFKYLQPALPAISLFPWFEIAERELGVAERAGTAAHPRIVDYLRSTTLRGSPMAEQDETPWCSAFVNWCVEQAGYAGTDSAAARSWLKWGRPVEDPPAGAIAVFWRGSKTGTAGHVGFVTRLLPDGQVEVLGGNQANQVCVQTFPRKQLLGFRLPA